MAQALGQVPPHKQPGAGAVETADTVDVDEGAGATVSTEAMRGAGPWVALIAGADTVY